METKYYVTETAIMKDGTNPCATFSYDSKENAKMAFHTTIASKLSLLNDIESFCVFAYDSNGYQIEYPYRYPEVMPA